MFLQRYFCENPYEWTSDDMKELNHACQVRTISSDSPEFLPSLTFTMLIHPIRLASLAMSTFLGSLDLTLKIVFKNY